MTRDDLFAVNAGIAKGLVESCARWCPNAVVALIVNPVNSIVPAMTEMWKKKGLDPRKILGITTLDCVRANKFIAEMVGCNAGSTILTLFSQDKMSAKIPKEKIPDLDKRVQDAGTEVVNAKAGKGGATLSMAYAGARLGKAVLQGLAGIPTTECAYVQSNGISSDLPYFASKVTFGPNGCEKVHPIGELNDYEKGRLAEVTKQLKDEIDTGLKYAAENSLA